MARYNNGFEGTVPYQPGAYGDVRPATQASVYGYEDVWDQDEYGPTLVDGAVALRAVQAMVSSMPADDKGRNAHYHASNYESGD